MDRRIVSLQFRWQASKTTKIVVIGNEILRGDAFSKVALENQSCVLAIARRAS